MGHNVGDAAKRSVQKGEARGKKEEALTPEVAIKHIRDGFRDSLFVPRDRFEILLAEYDRILTVLDGATAKWAVQKETLEADLEIQQIAYDAAMRQIEELESTVKTLQRELTFYLPKNPTLGDVIDATDHSSIDNAYKAVEESETKAKFDSEGDYHDEGTRQE